jgi:hypothetical protein
LFEQAADYSGLLLAGHRQRPAHHFFVRLVHPELVSVLGSVQAAPLRRSHERKAARLDLRNLFGVQTMRSSCDGRLS